jgi:hypothetical protein
MPPLHESGHDDQQLVRYLLRLLPDEEADRLDELSISDDDVAWRLRMVENDLVDAYVSGALTGERLERFESFYLSSARRREKVRFAGSFFGAVDRGAGPADTDAGCHSMGAPAVRQGRAFSRVSQAYGQIVPRSNAAWTLAAAAALLLLVCGGLLVQEAGLQNGLNVAQRESAALSSRAHELERQLDDQRAANTEAAKELERARASKAAAVARQSAAARPPDQTPGASQQGLTTIALVLLPQTRAVGPIDTLVVPQRTNRVAFELRLESNRFRRYQVALKDPATNQIVWRSGQLTATSPGDQVGVSAILPTSVLKPQHYSLELVAQTADGTDQVVGSYAVQIVFR